VEQIPFDHSGREGVVIVLMYLWSQDRYKHILWLVADTVIMGVISFMWNTPEIRKKYDSE